MYADQITNGMTIRTANGEVFENIMGVSLGETSVSFRTNDEPDAVVLHSGDTVTPVVSAIITATHAAGRKDSPFTIEGWINAETREQALALGEAFPDFVEVTVDRRYRRLFFRAYASDPMLSRLDQFLAACAAQQVRVEWKVYNPDTHYASREELAHHIG